MAADLIQDSGDASYQKEEDDSLLGPLNEMMGSLLKRVKMHPDGQKVLNTIAAYTQATEEQAVWGLTGSIVGIIFLFHGVSLAVTGVAWVYPLYRSCQAVREKTDQEKWLTYWIVYGLVSFISSFFLDYILPLLLPFYQVFYITLYLWLWHPTTNGAVFVYKKYIKPTLEKVQEGDSFMEEKISRRKMN